MKHSLYKIFLKVLRNFSRFFQIGNPAGKAPLLLKEPEEQAKMKNSVKLPGNMYVWKFENMLCSGLYGGAIINRQNQTFERFLIYPWGKEVHPILSFPYLGRCVASVEKAVFMITVATSNKKNYFHWLVDALPRMLLILKCQLEDFMERKIILHYPFGKYETETLKLLGIPEENVIRLNSFETFHVKDLIIADAYHSSDGKAFPLWKKYLLDDFKRLVPEAVNCPASKMFYLLRGPQRTRRLIGEERLVNVLQHYGFEVINPQEMTLVDQIRTLASAKVVVGLHGAALANTIFCKQNTLIVEMRSSFKPPDYYSAIAEVYNLRFETLLLVPERIVNARHLANEQNLLISDEKISELLLKVTSI